MKKILGIMCLSIIMTSCNNSKKEIKTPESEVGINSENIYQFKVNDLYGDEFDFSSLQGKKII